MEAGKNTPAETEPENSVAPPPLPLPKLEERAIEALRRIPQFRG